MDCTACLDCVHACPHDNVGLVAVVPGAGLWHDRQGSGVGRLARRPDIAALVVVLVFGAFANAAGMVAPVVEWQERLGVGSHVLNATLFYILALLVAPPLAVGLAAAVSRWWGQLPAGALAVATRYTYALVPLGFGMWLAHYSFHFLTSYDMAVPTGQRFFADLGWASFSDPDWVSDCCRPTAPWLLRLEVLFLEAGLLLSLYAGYRISVAQAPRLTLALKAVLPWAVLMLVLFATGVWVLFQPMQMRGTLPG
jgi:hypothetical protein